MTIKASCQRESDTVRELTRTGGTADRVSTALAMTNDTKSVMCVSSGRLTVRMKESLGLKRFFRDDRSGGHGVTHNRFQRIPVANVPLDIRFAVRGTRWRP